jgi:hypothetical protein
MVFKTHPVLTLPSAAIIIDAGPGEDWLANNIIDFLNKHEQIKLVILATGESVDGMRQDFLSTNQWYKSYYEGAGGMRRTHDKILNYTNSTKFLTLAPDKESFYRAFKKFPAIRNVYLMGADYKICVMQRPLGAAELKDSLLPGVANMLGCSESKFNILLVPDLLATLDPAHMRDINTFESTVPDLDSDNNLMRLDSTPVFKLTSLEHPYEVYNIINGSCRSQIKHYG